MVNKRNEITPLNVKLYFLPILMLALTGLMASVYLAYSHYRVYTDIGYASFCAVSKSINCDTVSQSPYSIFLNVPVPIWGVYGYLFLLLIILLSLDIRNNRIRILSTQFFLTFFFSVISLILGIISALKIHSYCIMCILTYAVNFLLCYLFWLLRRRYKIGSLSASLKDDLMFWKVEKKIFLNVSITFLVLFLILLFFLPNYWNIKASQNPVNLLSGYTEEGDPWIGALTPEVVIVEYTDYQCFQCKKMHFYLRNLLAEYPDRLKLIHRHFPLDQAVNPLLKESLHPGSGILAKIAIIAAKNNKFWTANDYLFNYDMSNKAIYLKQISEEIGLNLDNLKIGIHTPSVKQKLNEDIISGLKRNIKGTPSYVINDKVYTGQIPPEILEPYLK